MRNVKKGKISSFCIFELAFGWENAKCANERWQKRLGKKRINFCVGFSAVFWSKGIAYNGLGLCDGGVF